MNKARHSLREEWLRPAKNVTTSLLDIDVALTDIVFHSHRDGLDGFGARRPAVVVDYAIEGIVRPAPGAEESEAEPYVVYVSGYEDRDRTDHGEDFDPRSVCYISNDRRPDFAWSTNIYIENFIFRRLVELYATRRIDSARISILLKVLRDSSGAIDLPILSRPGLLGEDDRHRQHSRAHLMSVQTSLNGAGTAGPGNLIQPPSPRVRLPRRRAAHSHR